MNKYQENLGLMKQSGVNELEFLEKRIYDHKNTVDVVLSEVVKAYTYYKYLQELFYVTKDELKEEEQKQLHEDYVNLITKKEEMYG